MASSIGDLDRGDFPLGDQGDGQLGALFGHAARHECSQRGAIDVALVGLVAFTAGGFGFLCCLGFGLAFDLGLARGLDGLLLAFDGCEALLLGALLCGDLVRLGLGRCLLCLLGL